MANLSIGIYINIAAEDEGTRRIGGLAVKTGVILINRALAAEKLGMLGEAADTA
jgi:hypothetical protein